jgi:asparagine N-glycosylation enzyme membrane subunit Stt3
MKYFLVFIIALGAFSVRFFLYDDHVIMPDGKVVFRDTDSYYHMRRAEWTAANYPEIPYEDKYLYFPDKGTICWSGGYDLVLGSLFKIGEISGLTRDSIEILISFINPVLSFCTVFLIFSIASMLFGTGAGYLSSVIFAVFPPHILYSGYGNVDHHTAIALLIAGIAYSLVKAFISGASRKWLFITGCIIGVSHFFHSGFVLTSLIIIFVMAVSFVILKIKKHEDPGILLRKFRIIFASSSITTFIFSLSTPQGRSFEIHFWIFSMFHVLIPLSGWLLSEIFLTGVKQGRTRSIVSSIVLIIIFAAASLHGNLIPALVEGFNYTSGNYWFLGLQSESKSPLQYGLLQIFRWFTPLILIIPLYLIYISVKSIIEFEKKPELLIVILYGMIIIATGFFQFVFTPNASVFLAVFFGACISLISASVTKLLMKLFRVESDTFKNSSGLFFSLLILVPCLIPVYDDLSRLPGTSMVQLHKRDADAISRYLFSISDKTDGFFSKIETPQYSIFANRDTGHQIIYRAQRPVVVNPFGAPPSFIGHTRDFAKFALSEDPAEALKILQKYRVQYLINDPITLGEVRYYASLNGEQVEKYFTEQNSVTDLKSGYFKTMNTRLFWHDGSSMFIDQSSVEAIHYLKLLYESRSVMTLSGKQFPKYKLYQVVKGAIITGKTEPKTQVKCSIKLRTNTGRIFDFRTQAMSDIYGDFFIQFPYSTEINSKTGVIPVRKILIETARGKFFADLKESDVIEGKIVQAGPQE